MKFFLNELFHHLIGVQGGPSQQQLQQNREMNAQYGPGPSLRPQSTYQKTMNDGT